MLDIWIKVILVILVLTLIGGALMMLLWNYVVCNIFDVPKINVFMAIGINLLINMIRTSVVVKK